MALFLWELWVSGYYSETHITYVAEDFNSALQYARTINRDYNRGRRITNNGKKQSEKRSKTYRSE